MFGLSVWPIASTTLVSLWGIQSLRSWHHGLTLNELRLKVHENLASINLALLDNF